MTLYTVHAADGSIRAARVVFAEDAAAFVSVLGDGASVRVGRNVLWTEGKGMDGSAAESYDAAAAVIVHRVRSAMMKATPAQESLRRAQLRGIR